MYFSPVSLPSFHVSDDNDKRIVENELRGRADGEDSSGKDSGMCCGRLSLTTIGKAPLISQ